MSRTVKVQLPIYEGTVTISIWRDMTLEQLYNKICTAAGHKNFTNIGIAFKNYTRFINVRNIGDMYDPEAKVFYDHASVYDVDHILI